MAFGSGFVGRFAGRARTVWASLSMVGLGTGSTGRSRGLSRTVCSWARVESADAVASMRFLVSVWFHRDDTHRPHLGASA